MRSSAVLVFRFLATPAPPSFKLQNILQHFWLWRIPVPMGAVKSREIDTGDVFWLAMKVRNALLIA